MIDPSLLPATAGPAPTFYNDDAGDVEKVELDMHSLDSDDDWTLEITAATGGKLKIRSVK